MQFCSGYIKIIIYHFYNTDLCHLTLFLRVLIYYEALLSIIKRGYYLIYFSKVKE